MMHRWQVFALAFIAGLALVGGVAAASWAFAPRTIQFHGQAVTAAQPSEDFQLTTAGSRTVKLSDYRGQVVLLFFGFRYCPDICPTTLYELKRMLEALGPQADDVQVLMVTVDPERDSPDLISEHVSRIDSRFIGLGGTPDEIATAASVFGIYYTRAAGSANTGYLVTHTASVTALDQTGRVRVIYPFGTPGADIAADVKALLAP
jgi:protein SCO1/2